MQLAAHLALERIIDDLVLLHPGFAAKCLGQHGGGVVVAIAGEIADRDLCVGNPHLDQALDIACTHCHSRTSADQAAAPAI